MSGWKLPGYVVEDLLGFGGSGDVWRARVASTGAPVALKRIRIDGSAQVRAARAEAALLAALDHPHLVRLHEFVPTHDAVVLVLDLALGGSLAELLGVRGRITPGEAVTGLAPVGAALAYAHAAGVVHGDVTPSNVLFTEVGMPLLADLGVSRLLGDEAPAHSTPAYIDPAVAAGCVPGPQSDVFMLGAVTLHALTGRPVWPGDTAAGVLAAAAAGESATIDNLLATVDVPEAMRAVLARALSFEPSLRGTAADFALDLRHAGTPAAVELSAGRQRAPAGGLAVPGDDPQEGTLAGAVPPDAVGNDPGRPAFDRPGGVAGRGESAVLTHAVGPRPRPLPARGARGARRATGGQRARRPRPAWMGRGAPRRAAVVAGGAALLAAVVLAAIVFTGGGSSTATLASSSGASQTVEPPARLPPIPSGVASPAPAVPAVNGTAPLDAAGAGRVLHTLDALRGQAFAGRNPGLLSRVYTPGALLTQDTALLLRLVPTGCRLVGVRTGYRNLRVLASRSGEVTLSVSATLAGSVLVCNGGTTGHAPGAGPATLTIVLTRNAAGYVIATIGA